MTRRKLSAVPEQEAIPSHPATPGVPPFDIDDLPEVDQWAIINTPEWIMQRVYELRGRAITRGEAVESLEKGGYLTWFWGKVKFDRVLKRIIPPPYGKPAGFINYECIYCPTAHGDLEYVKAHINKAHFELQSNTQSTDWYYDEDGIARYDPGGSRRKAAAQQNEGVA